MTDTQQEYFASVQSIANEAAELPEDERHDFVRESIDGNYWVIYTHAARKVLEYSDNDCAIFEEMGPQQWEDWGTAFSQAAYFAMCQDVYDCDVEETD